MGSNYCADANLTRAIACFTEALRFLTADAAPLDYALAQSNLGAAYASLLTGDRAVHLARAIEHFTEALRFRTAKAVPRQYAATYHNLGVAYRDLLAGDRAVHLARAIECFAEALRFRTAEAAPHDYATTQSNLGLAYYYLPTGDRAVNLACAIECYMEALRFRIPEAAPDEYARTQNNLGLAYTDLPTGDRTANLARAIDCYTQALRLWTADAAPLDYAAAQNNLGLVYQGLLTGQRAVHLARAIDCYTEALRFWNAETAPDLYATTLNNLGTAYRDLPTGDRDANLTRAIGCYMEALRFRTPDAAPLNYSTTQNNLGLVYADLRTGDRAANLARAINCFNQALRFFTVEAAPAQYALAQNNLGEAYRVLSAGDPAANLTHAVDCYNEALRFHTPELAPANCRMTARSLGNVHFGQSRWVEAHAAYSQAIRAGELLYQATGSDAGRQSELGAAGDIVASDAYCLARIGRLVEAVQCLEAGRTRALSEALARDRAVLQEASPQDRDAFAAAAEQIKALEIEGRQGAEMPVTPGTRSFAERSAELVRARETLAELIQRIRTYLPEFMAEGLSYPEIATAATPERPLVYLLTTSRGSVALVVPAGLQAPEPEHAVWLDSLTTEQVNEMLIRQDSSDRELGYLSSQMTGNLDEFAPSVTETIAILRHELLDPLAACLADLGVTEATVIPVRRLSLLPLSAAAPDGCVIAVAPSARALRSAAQVMKERAGQEPVLLAVANPLPPSAGSQPLGYAELEVRAIKRYFHLGARRVLSEEAAALMAVAHGLPGTTHLHLACHGGFDPDEPLDSALYLASGDRLTLRGLLDGDLDLSSQQLAVLSACQTGVTEFNRIPDEVIGLPAGFLQAGIPGVVATLWPVSDLSTAVLMAEFYQLLFNEQQDPAAALAGARAFLRDTTAHDLAIWFERRFDESGGSDVAAYETAAEFRSSPNQADRPYANPVYWAGFVYTGP